MQEVCKTETLESSENWEGTYSVVMCEVKVSIPRLSTTAMYLWDPCSSLSYVMTDKVGKTHTNHLWNTSQVAENSRVI